MRFAAMVLTVVFGLLSPIGAGAGFAGVARAAPAGFQPGEAFTYTFSVGIIDAGRARMSVGVPEGRAGARMVSVQGDAHSAAWLALLARLDDSYRVVMDAEQLLPRRVRTIESGIRTRTISSDLAGARLEQGYHAQGKEPETFHRVLPGVARDPVAALFAFRAAPLYAGERHEMLVLDGTAVYRAIAVTGGRETLTTGEGPSARPVRVVRVDVTATHIFDNGRPTGQAPRHMRIYLSDDDLRIPYRMAGDTDFGEARLELTSYLPGSAAKAAAAPAPPPAARSQVVGGQTVWRALSR